tara:strand:+ start:65376 stop:65933 length:558 start_codon:yes stop_codon:yes gene_type:complete
MDKINAGDLVTYDVTKNASNTFEVDAVADYGEVAYLKHPLNDQCVVKAYVCDLNLVSAVLKDDTERCLDFANSNKSLLDYNNTGDLEAFCLYYVYKRHLTSKQKSALSNICGLIASIEFDNDIKIAMNFIVKNEGLLDDFNRMWYNNFKGLFTGEQAFTSKKQRASIFNIAGFVAAQLETPITSK